jgi:hypothetical protein
VTESYFYKIIFPLGWDRVGEKIQSTVEVGTTLDDQSSQSLSMIDQSTCEWKSTQYKSSLEWVVILRECLLIILGMMIPFEGVPN